MRAWLGLIVVAALSFANTASSCAEKPKAIWSAIIPDGFAGDIFTWHLYDNGTYTEDGREKASGQPIQSTLTGKWKKIRKHMILTQDTLGYVFKGDIVGDRYSGILYLGEQPVSNFCAAKGEVAPKSCADAPIV